MKNLRATTLAKMGLILCSALFLFSCSSDDNGDGGDSDVINPPIVLDCAYFDENENIHLTDDPDAPVDYIITCDPKIADELIIDAGVIIEFENNAGLQFKSDVNAKIQMNGTADKPIILTGVQKDKGSWRGLLLTSNNPANQMNHVTIEFAGQKRSGGWGLEGAVIGASKAVMKMDNCTFRHNAVFGLHWNGSSALDAGELTLSNSTFTKNDIPIETSINHINTVDASSTYTGNDKDYISLTSLSAYQDITFHKIDVPFLSVGIAPNNDAKRRFVFEPGVTLLMDAGSEINFNNAFLYDHEIIMKGTADERITIKGKEDAPGYWKGIKIKTNVNPLNEMAFVDIAHAGITSGYPNGAVRIESPDVYLNMHDINFIDCFEYAVSIQNTSTNVSYNNLNLDNTPKMFSDWDGNEITNP